MNNTKKLYPLFSFLLSVAIYLLIHAIQGIWFGSGTTLITGDLFAQYYGFIEMFLRVLKGQDSLLYTFSIFLGSGTPLTYAYYVLSPFNLLYLIPGISFASMTLLVTAFKHGLAAAFFCLYLQKVLKRDGLEAVFFSLCYALGTFSIGLYFNLMWFDALYTLPLIIIGIDELLKKKRMLPLILSYAYLFITNFYIAFIIGVFSALVFFWLLLYRTEDLHRETVRGLLADTLRYLLCGILAAGLCAVVLLPAGIFLFSHTAPDNFEFEPLKMSLADLFNSVLLGQMSYLDNDLPLAYCSLPVLLLIPLYFFSSVISRKEKILTICFFLIYLFASFYLPLYVAMHAFDYPNWYAYRFIWAFLFLLISCACRAFPSLPEYRLRIPALLIAVFLFLYSVLIPIAVLRHGEPRIMNTQNGFLINALFFVIWFVLLYFYKSRESKRRLIAVLSLLCLCAELTINGTIIFHKLDLPYISKVRHDRWYESINGALSEISENDNDFYRLHINNDIASNSATILGFHSVSGFNSSDDYHLRRALSSLGVSTTNRGIYDNGYYDITDMLLNIKYTVTVPVDLFLEPSENEGVSTLPEHTISRFDYALPLAYMVSETVYDYTPGEDPMQNQEDLLFDMTGNRYHFFSSLPEDDLLISTYGINYEMNNNMASFRRTNPLSDFNYVMFSAELAQDKDLYAYFPVDTPVFLSTSPLLFGSIPGIKTTIYLSSATLARGLRNNGDFEETPDGKYCSVMVTFTEATLDSYGVKAPFFKIYDNSALPLVYEDLNSHPFLITSMRDDDIYGTVEATADRPVLFTSIPYDRDWHAEIDGIPAETTPCVEDGFLSLRLTPGPHTIHLYYIPSGLKIGALISALSLIILIVTILLNRLRNTIQE